MGVRVGSLSLHWSPGAEDIPPVRLYDLAADPNETTDLAQARPADVARLKSLIEDHQRTWVRARPETLEGGARAAAMLRAIGYAGDDE